jgi:hypothetical protein
MNDAAKRLADRIEAIGDPDVPGHIAISEFINDEVGYGFQRVSDDDVRLIISALRQMAS